VQTPRFSAYTEVAALGAPGHYVGLILASEPVGFGKGGTWSQDGATELEQAVSSGKVITTTTAAKFRAGTTPNTYGQYRDDGPASLVFGHAGKVFDILFLGSNY